MVGNIPANGTEALAAVGIVGSFLSMLIWILAQTRAAISSIVSQNLGAGKLDDLKSFPAQAIYFNVGLSILVLAGTYAFVEEIFRLLNASGQILELSLQYYDIRVWGFPFTLFTFAIFGLFRGLQNTFWPMVIAASGALINIGLDFLLVYGWDDIIPAMGIRGAAWASLMAQLLMAVMSLILLLKKTHVSLRLEFPIHPEIRRLVYMSFNLFIRSLALNAALMLAVREATFLGTKYIAAHAIAINLWLFAAFFLDGYGAAGNILGGKLKGAGQFITLVKLSKRVNSYNLVVAGILMFFGVLLYQPLGLLFNKDPEVLAVFSEMFYLAIISLPICAIAFTLDAIFKGMGEMKYLRNVLVGATVIGFIPSLYLFKYLGWGIQGIWLAIIVWISYRALALLIEFGRKYVPLARNST